MKACYLAQSAGGIQELTTLKSKREIEAMRDAGRIVAECHAALAERVKPGVTTEELDVFIDQFLRTRGALPSCKGYHGFPASCCTSVNDVVCHGIPSRQHLKRGDVVTIDVMALYKGYHGDSAWTYAVGDVSAETKRLMQVCLDSLNAGIGQALVGNRVGDISHAIQSFAESRGMGVVRDFVGHGVGRELHEDPQVPHFGKPAVGPLLRAGMVLAIEPMITLGDWRVKTDLDGWTARTADASLCVQYEHTVAVTEEGPLILTQL